MKYDVEVKINIEPAVKRIRSNISKAQKHLDEAVLKESEPYTPKLTGRLIRSSVENTETGGGSVVWKTPYARIRYYTPGKIGSQTGPRRGFRWVDRMLVDHGPRIIAETKKIGGGG